eukprot:gnl/TRDRNA2_/TRDRNA2_156542_c1_seq1.p1 gnl/TRDRNA2_/TRDRNA2_156542_c1~~gnl/TRDRNA2_/TRDRNA2_156542_c1_seq1.p1  ORF type:complete len:775 (+),score=142.89 gnl/TRDRNA2_/TRDRNA2_156542_c1_seq1:179-2326(+)
MARLNLWPATAWPSHSNPEAEFPLHGRGLTDVGLRGLCALLRHFAALERGTGASPGAVPSGSGRGALHLTRIDLSGNEQITDASVADLCHTLQNPAGGSALRQTLRELSVRSCSRLRTRSAYELLQLANHARDTARDGASSALGSSLQVINGVDLALLQANMRSSGNVGTRSSGVPMLFRTFVQVDSKYEGSSKKPESAALSECDVHFFASMLHFFTQIPYCHVHIIVPKEEDRVEKLRLEDATWGPPGSADGPMSLEPPPRVSNQSPFPPPVSLNPLGAAEVQAHVDTAKRLFEASPISTQLRISMVPCIRSCEDLLMEGDSTVMAPLVTTGQGERSQGGSMGMFNRVKQRLEEKAAKARKQRQKGPDAGAPRRPLYVNNINSQRLHDCFRTLYGQDDVELEHDDLIVSDRAGSVQLPADVDIAPLFGIATSVDLQHLELSPVHFHSLSKTPEMPVLTHVNLNHNTLGDLGVEMLFLGLEKAGSHLVHVAVSSNNIGDRGAVSIANCLGSLPRLTSLELCNNFVQERGSIALAEVIGGVLRQDDSGLEPADEVQPMPPLPMLSVDLKGNRSRELGAMRWAEVISSHPTMQFLCLARNELGRNQDDSFLALVYAAVSSPTLSVLDLRENFMQGPGEEAVGPPKASTIEDLLQDLPEKEFDAAEVRQAVFIRRNRGSAGAPEKKGRQPQQGHQGGGGAPRHTHAQHSHSSPGHADH